MKPKKTTHKYQIDQSIKIENTSKASYVCISNDTNIVVSIAAKDKRELEIFFRELDKPLIFKTFTFSVLCATALIQSKAFSATIDKEYPGHEVDIESFIVQILTIWKAKIPQIMFKEIGKGSPAHLKGYQAFKHHQQDKTVTVKEVLILYNLINKS